MIKPILQDEVSECGLACIAMVVNEKGGGTSLFELRRKYQVSKDGLSMYQLIRILGEFGINSLALSGNYQQLKDLNTPAILFWNKSHFVVLEKVVNNSVTIVDPAMGRKTYSLDEVKYYFSGMALEIDDKKLIRSNCHQQSGKYVKYNNPFSLSSLIKNSAWLYTNLILLFLLVLSVNLFSLAAPKLFSLTIDEVVTKNDKELLYLIIYIFGLAFILLTAFKFVRAKLNVSVRKIVENDVSSSFVSYMVRLPLDFFEKRTSASILRKLQALDVLHVKFTAGWADILGDAIFSLVFLVLMAFINEKLAFLSIFLCSIFVVFRLISVIRLEKYQKDSIDREIERNSTLLSIVDEMKVNKLYGNNKNKASEWSAKQSKSVESRAKLDYIQEMNSVIFSGISNSQSLVISCLGAIAILNGDNSIGDIFAFVLYKDLFLDSVLRIIDRYMNLRIVNVELNRLDDILAVEPEREYTNAMAMSKSKSIKSIDLKDISFSYGTFENDILKNINFSIKSGEHISLIGKSGCGKSTLMSIISSLYEVKQGDLFINGRKIKEYGVELFRSRISFVTANSDILVGSICDNITMSDVNYNIEKVIQCIKEVGLYDEVLSLPAGLHTRVGHGGTMLSSGQIQRLMLARALYREPDLLILDEPTSHLDEGLKSQIMELLSKQSCSIISVTHDKDMCSYSDKVYELNEGNLIHVSN
ncbi:peptidase domain-containing ABC transporter [Vibrio crassostreae]|uniref:peptidase domain-containing ABC transporter n=1 Tax=Vibrio crassostreae TaxID=246167 RepID=UPI001B30DA5F|nr:peptidase domain-containing ABC transporter [Vibrio crassostreae]CAK3511311.1 Peptidase domain-containing ABC transporter [Vibrio crassostreae]CAK3518113.1 Peptidase domain-containing ABC transporter [Vibrio crassostreae]CAK3914049.1 Peptidase domain-containing ABC transporter [Vibrio crassostreae]